MRLSNHTRKAMHNVPTCQLPRYYQPYRVPRQFKLFRSHDIRARNRCVLPKYCKSFDSLKSSMKATLCLLYILLFSRIQKPTYCYHHHHHLVPQTRISLTLSRHFSLSFIASDRSSGLHPVSSHTCCMYVRAGRPAFALPYVGVHRSTSLMSSSLPLQQCPACLVRLAWIVFVMGGRWPYSWCLVGCCRQDLFNIARSILV